jgi:hypothetical protein
MAMAGAFKRPVLSNPAFRLNIKTASVKSVICCSTPTRLQLIDECAALVAGPAGKPSIVDADRAK